MQKISPKEYKDRLKAINSPLTPLEPYINYGTALKHQCVNGHIVLKNPGHALNGSGCRECYFASKRKTIQQYRKDLKKKHGKDFVVVGTNYVNAMTHIEHKCTKCGYTRDYTPNDVLSRDNPCPYCSGEFLSHEQYCKRLYAVRSNVKLVGKYISYSNNVKVKCLDCNNVWYAAPYTLIISRQCPVCARDAHASGANRNTHRRKSYKVTAKLTVQLQGYEPQALDWLRKHKHNMKDLAFSVQTGKPVIPYVLLGKAHNYYPDFYIPSTNTVVEVKCEYTLGLTHLQIYRKVAAKAKATKEAGFKLSTMVMSSDGRRLKLPKGWYDMTRKELVSWLRVNRKYHD